MKRLAVLLALLLAPVAAAQEPQLDEPAAALAMAEAAKRLSTAIDDLPDRPSPVRGCAREWRGVSERRFDGALALLERHTVRSLAGALRADLARLRTELANARTRDPALLSGRAAYRRFARHWMAMPRAGDFCAEVRAWQRAGMPKAPVRQAKAETRRFWQVGGREFERKSRAAARRMIELGVPQELAEEFGELE